MSKLTEYKELIRELAELLDKSTLSEIEVEEDDFRIRVARETVREITTTVPAAAAPQMAAAPAPVAAAPAASAPAAETGGSDHPGAVPSPMVGTIYRAASPESAPFVEEGSTVKEGDTIAIIEAMKVMNQIAAPRSGTVTKILFQDSQAVEYGEPLCIIE